MKNTAMLQCKLTNILHQNHSLRVMNEPCLAIQMCYLEMLDQFHCMLFSEVSNLQTKAYATT